MGRWGGTGPESGIGDAAKGGLGNGWSVIRTTQEPVPDGPLEAGEVTCACVNAARVACKAEPADAWWCSLMHFGEWRSELHRRSSELRQVQKGAELQIVLIAIPVRSVVLLLTCD